MTADETPARRSPRRAPKPEERGKAGEQTRERILEAAVEEFGAKGFAGARTAAIAARAGVNQQLISYYFGGKQGLLDELRRRWASDSSHIPTDLPFGESVGRHLDAALDNPDWARLVVWQALGDVRGGDDEIAAAQRTRMRQAVERIRGRQAAGEISDALEPEFILLVAYALTFAPVALPHFVAGVFGVDPLSAEYRGRVREQISKMVNSASADKGADNE
ncbi:MAG: TetR family transcriptional regulator [Stackebrandtia sp.]